MHSHDSGCVCVCVSLLRHCNITPYVKYKTHTLPQSFGRPSVRSLVRSSVRSFPIRQTEPPLGRAEERIDIDEIHKCYSMLQLLLGRRFYAELSGLCEAPPPYIHTYKHTHSLARFLHARTRARTLACRHTVASRSVGGGVDVVVVVVLVSGTRFGWGG